MKNATLLSIVIVNFNTNNYLKQTLLSLLALEQTNIELEIIVVDNASNDDSVEMAKKEFPMVITVANKENVGFAKANNIGIKKTRGEFILFLNPDTIVKSNVLEELVSFMIMHQDAGAVTCKLVTLEGKEDEATHRGFPTPWNSFCYFSGLTKLFPTSRIFSGYTKGYLDLTKIQIVDAIEGAFMLTRKIAGEKIGWWDEDYFFYGEDIEFCYQLKKNGYNVYYNPFYTIYHYRGVTAGIKKGSDKVSNAKKDIKIKATRERFRAMKLFYTKHYSDNYPKIVKWIIFSAINFKERKQLRRFSE